MAARLGFRGKLLLSHLAVVVAVVAVVILALNRTLGAELLERLDARLHAQARGAREWVSAGRARVEGGGDRREPEHGGGGGQGQAQRLPRIAARLADVVDARVIITDEAGHVLGDSGQPAGVDEADMRFVSEPIGDGLVVRLGVPMNEVRATLESMRNRILVAAAIGLIVAIGLGLLAARVAARPLAAMTASATRIAQGEYHLALPPPTKDEFGVLQRALESLAAQLEARIGELVREEKARRDFLANASHELRTPVTAIRGYAETLLASSPGVGVDDATRRGFVEIIHRHADRIGRLVEDMLALSALEAHAATVVHEPVELAAIARQVQATLRRRADDRRARVRLDIPDDLVALGDPDGLERVVQNLVDNALKYGREGGEVVVTGRRAGGHAIIEVADDGPGIAAEHLPRLFERFYRVDPGRAREQGGTGLGLAIVKQLCEQMGGRITVASAPGRGTCFTVAIPEVAAAPAPASPAARS